MLILGTVKNAVGRILNRLGGSGSARRVGAVKETGQVCGVLAVAMWCRVRVMRVSDVCE